MRVDIVGIDILGLITCRNLVWQRLSNISQLCVKEDEMSDNFCVSNIANIQI